MYNLNTTSSFHVTSPAGTYVYDIVPVAAGLAAISSDDSLRLLDPLALNAGPVNEIKKVNADVTCLKAVNTGGEGDAVVVCTAGRDGKVALWDPRSGAKVGEVRSGKLHGSSQVKLNSAYNIFQKETLQYYHLLVHHHIVWQQVRS